MEYIVGRSNLACTIFVPFDCANNCPFCTSKEMYRTGDVKMDLDAILNCIGKVNKNHDVTEYVMTGGEPFADLNQLRKMIDACEKPVYINTTLPLYKGDIDEVVKYINSEHKISGINISRHMTFNFKGVADRDVIDRIVKPVRVNTVLPDEMDLAALAQNISEFAEYWGNGKRLINLRANYKNIDFDNLKTLDNVERLLSRMYIHKGGGGCLVCNTVQFDAGHCSIQYHRGKMLSSVNFGDKTYVNDIIMLMDGSLYSDWDFKADDEFRAWLIKEEDIHPTILEFNTELMGGTTISYYPKGVSGGDVFLTRKIRESMPITNKKMYDEVISLVKDKLGDLLIGIREIPCN